MAVSELPASFLKLGIGRKAHCDIFLDKSVWNRTFSLRRASLMGRVVRGIATEVSGVLSAMAAVYAGAIGRFEVAIDVCEGVGCGRR